MARQEGSYLYVAKQFTSSGETVSEEDKEELLQVHRFVTEPAKVGVEFGTTINMGNFEFVKISVSITVPCYKEEEEAAWEFARKTVADRMFTEVGRVRDQASSGGKSKDDDDLF